MLSGGVKSTSEAGSVDELALGARELAASVLTLGQGVVDAMATNPGSVSTAEIHSLITHGCVNPIWDHDDGLTGTHLAPANHALGLGGHCRVARAIGICRPDRGYRFRALGGLHRRGAQPRCREVL